MADICASCAYRLEEEITKGLYGLSCDYGFSGVVKKGERTGKVQDCEDYEEEQ